VKLETKVQVARTSLSLLVQVAVLFLLGVVVLVVCAGLQINPFRETTTSFLLAMFMGLIGVAAILVLLNVATNISLIADARIAELQAEPRPGVLKKWVVMFACTAAVLVGFVFLGTYLSKERYLQVVGQQVNEIVQDNRPSFEEVGHLLVSGKPEDFKRLDEIHNYLATRRPDLSQLTILYSGKVGDKVVYYRTAGDYYYNPQVRSDPRVYYTCMPKLDCDYLKKFFAGEKVDILRKYTMRDDRFYFYVPVTTGDSRFVLLFERWNSYGKIGS
jgi:hypothetical protein